MNIENTESSLAAVITSSSRERIPPELHVATGHEDEVMIFLLEVRNANDTAQLLLGEITMREAPSIIVTFRATNGLIGKRFHIDTAYRLKEQLESVGTRVEFVRPDDIGELWREKIRNLVSIRSKKTVEDSPDGKVNGPHGGARNGLT